MARERTQLARDKARHAASGCADLRRQTVVSREPLDSSLWKSRHREAFVAVMSAAPTTTAAAESPLQTRRPSYTACRAQPDLRRGLCSRNTRPSGATLILRREDDRFSSDVKLRARAAFEKLSIRGANAKRESLTRNSLGRKEHREATRRGGFRKRARCYLTLAHTLVKKTQFLSGVGTVCTGVGSRCLKSLSNISASNASQTRGKVSRLKPVNDFVTSGEQ